MKRIISFAAAVIMAFSGIGNLALDVSAATKTTRTGKQLTYEEAYDRLKDLEFAKGATDSKTTTKTTTKTTNKTTENKKTTTSDVVTMTDYKGKALSDSMYVRRNALNKDQLYLYDTIKTAALNGDTSAKFKKAYSNNDITTAVVAVMADNPYMVWVKSYNTGTYAKTGYTSVNIRYVSDLVKDKSGALQTMDDYLKPMLDKAAKMSLDIDKVKFVHDWLIYNVNNGADKIDDMYYHGAYAAIVNKKGVCQAYSNAFVYCMQKLGIVATNVHGTTWSGESHIWNMVKVGGDWYELDVYWDDIITKAETDFTYTCFMQTTESLKAYDTYNGVSRTRNSFDGSTLLPIAKGIKYSPDNYSYTNGTDFSNLAKVVITKKKTLNASKSKSSTSKSKKTLPSGWYKHSCVLSRLGVKSVKESEWTQDGNFYFIEKKRNGKGTGQYVVYDVAYDNYYTWHNGGKVITWYNYQKGSWMTLS